jgi:hypothetical protein
VTVSLTADVAQPGGYQARITVTDDTPYATASLPVAMDVAPANNWGRITGTVTGLSCDGDRVRLAGATVHLDGRLYEATVTTGADGRYAYWFPVRNNRVTLTVSRPDYEGASRSTLVLPLRDVTEDFTLHC